MSNFNYIFDGFHYDTCQGCVIFKANRKGKFDYTPINFNNNEDYKKLNYDMRLLNIMPGRENGGYEYRDQDRVLIYNYKVADRLVNIYRKNYTIEYFNDILITISDFFHMIDDHQKRLYKALYPEEIRSRFERLAIRNSYSIHKILVWADKNDNVVIDHILFKAKPISIESEPTSELIKDNTVRDMKIIGLDQAGIKYKFIDRDMVEAFNLPKDDENCIVIRDKYAASLIISFTYDDPDALRRDMNRIGGIWAAYTPMAK